MKNVGILVILLEFLFHVNGQPWSTRFDYDYEPEPIPIRPSNQAVYRRPIQMRGVPRYRPPGISPLQQQQLSEIAEPIYPEVRSRPQPGLEIAASSFGGSYGSQPEPSRIQSESASNSVSDFMNRLVTTIPEIAEKMAKMAPTESK
uniref:Uncharacterized protein n=1 Tax=Panagrolaimus sp. JU765 TaxID=591449 RepID=A0AC34R134_9BILA